MCDKNKTILLGILAGVTVTTIGVLLHSKKAKNTEDDCDCDYDCECPYKLDSYFVD